MMRKKKASTSPLLFLNRYQFIFLNANLNLRVISAQNDLYSTVSRLSQKSKLFNKIVWEPFNYEGFRKLSYNAEDQKNA